MPNWIEISLSVDGEGAEAVADVLRRYVRQGVAIEHAIPDDVWPEEIDANGPLIVRGYIPEDADSPDLKRQIEEALYFLGRLYPIPEPTFRTVAEEDWANAWKKNYRPVRVGKRLLIKPAWAEAEIKSDDIVIELDPGMAFGTGTHPTTQLCLRACEWFIRPGTTAVLDLGTGSGILAIAAAFLGATRVLARDVDELAVQAATENVARNGVANRVTVQRGSLEGLVTSARHFEIGLANLTARIILGILEDGLQHVVYPGGKFIFSGIIEDQMGEVVDALSGIGLDLLGHRQQGDWVMLITQRRWD